ncbi:MAG: aldo/keto reductase [Bacteroidota bacterium]|nr:aldo/keto reductase [Bacteroidota bacterium]
MEYIKFHNIDQEVSRIGLGTWAIGGWMWGGTDEEDSVKTIRTALDKGINLLDTAPAYGFGVSEEIVGKALKEHGKREKVVIATKVGLDWDEDAEKKQPFRNSSPERIMKEIDDSLKRLQTDYIDIYLVHWPDSEEAFEKTSMTLFRLMELGKIRSIGVSNYSPEQMDQFMAGAPLHVNEPPFNLFEREAEKDVLPYCQEHEIRTLGYGALCRGMLSGKMSRDREFKGDDLRKYDPKFQGKSFEQYLEAAEKLETFAREKFDKNLIQLAVRWVLDRGVSTALWGARKPSQLKDVEDVSGWKIDESSMKEIDKILKDTIKDPVGPEFMGPPSREGK